MLILSCLSSFILLLWLYLWQSINRALLHWLKLWDYLVFGKEMVIKNKEKKEDQKKYKKKNEPAVLEELDKHKRPLQKVNS